MTKLVFKIVAVIVITIGLLIPLALIGGLIQERTRYRAEARADIARSWTGAQDLLGPLLVVPARRSGSAEEGEDRYLFVLPETLEIRASLRTETRRRGLYAVPVYYTQLAISGEFDLSQATLAGGTAGAELDPDLAFLALSFSDNRGIVAQPKLVWAGGVRELSSGSMLSSRTEGVHAFVGPLDPGSEARYPFQIDVELRGMETLQFAPAGRNTRVVMDAGWSHPSFVGRFLPVEYEIDAERFTAEWRVSGLAAGRPQTWFGGGRKVAELLGNTFGVSLINTVDIYQQAMRSVKYGHLIVLLTFTAFFLVEMVRRLRLHPLQYLLVGLALVIFFLLLLALSEHMAFGIAYLVAAIACVGLIAFYTASTLGRAANVAGLTATLGGLYGMLYAILQSEDNALLMGSLVLFFALAAVMLVTRRFDWYRLGQQSGSAGVAVEPRTDA